jgi:ArsR family transcriptional regulator, arsenate/arsenite/antimonite-responsive transcriptional repressor
VSTATRPDHAQLARWFSALSDETRLQIVGMLVQGECCVCELQDALDAYQSRLSFHLRKLKDVGLVTDRKEGRWVYYSLNPEVLEGMGDFLAASKPVEHASSCGCRSCC